ncbi:MAG: hypothetical protein ACKOX6_08075 [Bdellovibrio sp.]
MNPNRAFLSKLLEQTFIVWLISWAYIVWPVVVGRRLNGQPYMPFLWGMTLVALLPAVLYLLCAIVFKIATKRVIKWWGLILTTVVIWLLIIEVAKFVRPEAF